MSFLFSDETGLVVKVDAQLSVRISNSELTSGEEYIGDDVAEEVYEKPNDIPESEQHQAWNKHFNHFEQQRKQ